MLQRPGDEVGTKEHCVARSGPMCVQTTYLIRISVDRQLGGGKASQERP
jgi:hypothetical protein